MCTCVESKGHPLLLVHSDMRYPPTITIKTSVGSTQVTRDIIIGIRADGRKPVRAPFTAQDVDTTRTVVRCSNSRINDNNTVLPFDQASATAFCHRQTEPLERSVKGTWVAWESLHVFASSTANKRSANPFILSDTRREPILPRHVFVFH